MTSPSVDRRYGLNASAAIKVPVRVATTANITLNGLQSIDGVTVVADDRVLVKNQTNTVNNGIYLADTGAWTRDVDFNGARDIVKGTIITVNEGSIQARSLWRVTTSNPITIGSSSLTFVENIASANDSSNFTYLPAGTGAVATTVQAKLRENVSVADKGATGDGSDERADLVNAFSNLITAGGGTLSFAPGKTYDMNTDALGGTTIFDATGLSGLVIDGNGATIRTSSGSAAPIIFYLYNTNGVIVRNMNFVSQYNTLHGTNGPVWFRLGGSTKNVFFQNCTFTYGSQGIVVTYTAMAGTRVSGVTAINCTFNGVYYPQLFQTNGDNYFARGIKTINCGRGYFAYNVRNHDVHMESEHGGPFSDVLLKVYAYTGGAYSKLENIKLNYSSPGRYTGAGAQASEEAFVAFDFQQGQAGTASGEIIDVDVKVNVTCATPATNANAVIFRKYTEPGGADVTTRGYVVRNFKIGGRVVNAENLTQDGVRLFSVANGSTWTGENLTQIVTRDLNVNGSNVTQNHLYINAQANLGTGQNFIVDNVVCAGNIALVNNTLGSISIDNSKFNNLTRLNAEGVSYTPTVVADGGGNVSGMSAVAYAFRTGKQITVQGSLNINDATKMGVGPISITLPTTAANAYAAVGSYFGVLAGAIRAGSTVVLASGTNCYFAAENTGNFLNAATYAFVNTNYIGFSITYVTL
jgi:hypothetical protein